MAERGAGLALAGIGGLKPNHRRLFIEEYAAGVPVGPFHYVVAYAIFVLISPRNVSRVALNIFIDIGREDKGSSLPFR